MLLNALRTVNLLSKLKNLLDFFDPGDMAVSVESFYPLERRIHVRKVIVEERIYFEIDGEIYYVEEGFESDGATVPRLFWNIVAPFGRHSVACYFHDKFLKSKDRQWCDKAFYHLMRHCDVKSWRARLMFYAVRIYGGLK